MQTDSVAHERSFMASGEPKISNTDRPSTPTTPLGALQQLRPEEELVHEVEHCLGQRIYQPGPTSAAVV